MDGSPQPTLPAPLARAERLRRAIVRTVAYADLFDFPLRAEEIWRQLLLEPATRQEIASTLRGLEGDDFLAARLARDGDTFTLHGRVGLAALRSDRAVAAERLIAQHRTVLRALPLLPWLRMVAFSGGTSRRNSIHEDDLDLFVVAAPGHAWTVFLGLVLLSRATGCRDVLCANYVVDGRHLQVPDGGDLFTGQELLALEPLHGRRQLERMAAINDWASVLLPNAGLRADLAHGAPPPSAIWAQRGVEVLALPLGFVVERAARAGLGWHLRRKQRRAVAGDMMLRAGMLKLHQSDNRSAIVARFRAKLEALDVDGDDLDALLEPRRRRGGGVASPGLRA